MHDLIVEENVPTEISLGDLRKRFNVPITCWASEGTGLYNDQDTYWSSSSVDYICLEHDTACQHQTSDDLTIFDVILPSQVKVNGDKYCYVLQNGNKACTDLFSVTSTSDVCSVTYSPVISDVSYQLETAESSAVSISNVDGSGNIEFSVADAETAFQ